MGVYLLSGLFLLAFGALNAFAAENLERRLRLALVRFATRNRAVVQSWSGVQFGGAWQGRSMRERHNTKSRTDHTPACSVKIKTPPPTPLVAPCKQVWQLGDVARYAPRLVLGRFFFCAEEPGNL